MLPCPGASFFDATRALKAEPFRLNYYKRVHYLTVVHCYCMKHLPLWQRVQTSFQRAPFERNVESHISLKQCPLRAIPYAVFGVFSAAVLRYVDRPLSYVCAHPGRSVRAIMRALSKARPPQALDTAHKLSIVKGVLTMLARVHGTQL